MKIKSIFCRSCICIRVWKRVGLFLLLFAISVLSNHAIIVEIVSTLPFKQQYYDNLKITYAINFYGNWIQQM